MDRVDLFISNLLTSFEIWLFDAVISQTFCDRTSYSNQFIISPLLSSLSVNIAVNMKGDYYLLNKLSFPFAEPLYTCSLISIEMKFLRTKWANSTFWDARFIHSIHFRAPVWAEDRASQSRERKTSQLGENEYSHMHKEGNRGRCWWVTGKQQQKFQRMWLLTSYKRHFLPAWFYFRMRVVINHQQVGPTCRRPVSTV